MPRFCDLVRLDLNEIGHRALAAGAAVLAEAASRRASAKPGAAMALVIQDDRATVRLVDPALIRRERGDEGQAPKPLLAPDDADRQAIRAAVVESLRKDLM